MEHHERDAGAQDAQDALAIINHRETLASRLDDDVLGEIFFRTIPPLYLMDASLVGNPDSAWCQALRTKKALTLVCKRWYNAAIPLFYRDIALRKVGQVLALAHTLFQFDASGSLSSHIGSLRVSCYVAEIYTSVFLSDLGQILARCPSITQIHIDAFNDSCYPSSLYQNDQMLWMIQNLPSTIEHLTFGSQVCFPYVIPRLVDCPHRLTSLTFSGLEEGITDNPEVKIDFPNLTDLRYTFQWYEGPKRPRILPNYIAENWNLPKLNSLSICMSRFVQYQMEDWMKFFDRNGPKLHRLMILWTLRDSHNVVMRLLNRCTSLHHLVLPYDPTLRISSNTVKYLDLCRNPLAISEVGLTLTRVAPNGLDSDTLPELCCIRDIYDLHAYVPFAIPPTADFKVDLDYPGIRLVGYAGAVFKTSSSYWFSSEYLDVEDEMDTDEESDEHPLSDSGSEYVPGPNDDESGTDVYDSSESDDDSEYWSDSADFIFVGLTL